MSNNLEGHTYLFHFLISFQTAIALLILIAIAPLQFKSDRTFIYSGKSGITHLGGSDRFFLTASSAISSILSREVFSMKLDVAAAYSRFGHLSPKMQPLTHSTAQFTVLSTIFSFLRCCRQFAGRCSQILS